MAKNTTHRFKPDFAALIAAGQASGPVIDGRLVTPATLTDEDAVLFAQYGYGHLLEPIASTEEPAATHKAPKAAPHVAEEPAAKATDETPAKKK